MKNDIVPEGWKIKKLGEVCEIITGTTPPKSDPTNYGNDIPFFKPPHLWDTTINTTVEKLSFLGSKKARIVPMNTVLVTCIGNLGRTGILKQGGAFNQQINAILENSDIIGKYIFYHAQSLYFKKQMEQLATGTTVSIVNKSNFEKILIQYPSVQTQQVIVSKIEELFSELDKGITELKQAQEQLKVYKQSVLKYAFEGRLTNENVKGGELPESWELVKLVEVCQVKRGKSKHRPRNEPKLYGGQYPFIQTGDIRKANGGYIKNYTQTYSDIGLEQSKLWPKGTLCITIAANIGETAILNFDACFPDSVVGLLSTVGRLNNIFLNYYLISFKSKLEELAPATAQKNINVDILENVKIPLPPLSQQFLVIQEIEKRLSVADKMEESITESLQKAEALRQSILKKAFSGELVTEIKAIETPKIKNEYFHQLQLVALMINGFKKKKIDHGEMTLAKNLYLLDSIYKIPTGFKYDRWHLGPYPPALKKVVNNKEYFKRSENFIETTNDDKFQKYSNPLQGDVNNAITDLSSIFSKYKGAERSRKTELLATVCKVIEDIKSTDLAAVRQSMKEWKIELTTSKFKNKAEKFNETETEKCIGFIVERGWDRKLIS